MVEIKTQYSPEQFDQIIRETESYPKIVEMSYESLEGEDDKAVEYFEELLKLEYPQLSEDTLSKLSTGFQEAFTNALYHGNLGMSRSEFVSIGGNNGNKPKTDKQVTVRYVIEKNRITVTILDEGKGFNPADVPDPNAPENLLKPGGRGIFLYKQFFTKADIEKAGKDLPGMKVTLTKEFSEKELAGLEEAVV